jgi:hypothetical protein
MTDNFNENQYVNLKELSRHIGWGYDRLKSFVKHHTDIPHILSGPNRDRKLYKISTFEAWLLDYERRCTEAAAFSKKK